MKQKYNKLKEKLEKNKFFSEQKIFSIEDLPNQGAFIIFEKFEDKEQLRKLFDELNKTYCCSKKRNSLVKIIK